MSLDEIKKELPRRGVSRFFPKIIAEKISQWWHGKNYVWADDDWMNKSIWNHTPNKTIIYQFYAALATQAFISSIDNGVIDENETLILRMNDCKITIEKEKGK